MSMTTTQMQTLMTDLLTGAQAMLECLTELRTRTMDPNAPTPYVNWDMMRLAEIEKLSLNHGRIAWPINTQFATYFANGLLAYAPVVTTGLTPAIMSEADLIKEMTIRADQMHTAATAGTEAANESTTQTPSSPPNFQSLKLLHHLLEGLAAMGAALNGYRATYLHNSDHDASVTS